MASNADFVEFLKDQLRGLGHVTSRRMFSGAGIYCDGVIFALLLGDTLYFKVDDGNRAAYEAEGLEPFTYQARANRFALAPTGACRSACSTTPRRCWSGRVRLSRPGSVRRPRRSRGDVGRNRRQPSTRHPGICRRQISGTS